MENNIGERKQNVTTAESKVVGMVLRKPQYMQDFHQKLTHDVFSIDSHKTIYKVMVNLFNESLEPDFDLVRTALQSSNLLDSVGGIDYLNHLKELPTETDFKNKAEYISTINKAFKSREILKIGKYVQQLEENIDIVDTVADDIRSRMDFIDTRGNRESAAKISSFLYSAWEVIKEKVENPGIIGIPTGFGNVDSITGGYRGGNLWVVGGRPSHGKTAWILNSALSTARLGHGVLIYSLEMNEQQLVERFASLISGIDHTKIMLGNLSPAEVELTMEAFQEMNSLPIMISTIYDLEAGEITREIKRVSTMHKIEVVWIDYVQLTTERDGDAVHTIGRISRACKLLAKELDIFIGLVSQLNRNVEMRDDKRPRKADLRQSGNLEEDADLVAFIYRDEVYNKNEEANKGILEFIVDKHRNGPIGTLMMRFRKETMGIFADGEQAEKKRDGLGTPIGEIAKQELNKLRV